jgi:intraflagellar transport protein 172
MASSRDGSKVISGHLDGSIYEYSMEHQSFKKFFTHHSIPYCLGYGESIVAAGNDQKVTFYDTNGNVLQRFDYTHDDKVKDFTVAQFNPSG